MTNIAKMRLRITEKVTRRTWLAFWPWENGIALCAATGRKVLVIDKPGYSEFNDRNEPVLDSWLEPVQYVRLVSP